MVIDFSLAQHRLGPRGFTLIECAAVLLVAGLVLAASVPGFSRFKDSMDLRNALIQVQSDLRLARRAAAAGGSQTVVVIGSSDDASYSILYDKNADRREDPGELLRTRTLPGAVRFVEITLTPPDSIIFTSQGMLPDPGDGGTLAIENSRGDQRSVTIWSSGSVAIPD